MLAWPCACERSIAGASPTIRTAPRRRGIDPVAPLIHEWTYEAMVYDLLSPRGNVVSIPGATPGAPDREHVLDEGDALWMEFRHCHIAEVLSSLAKRLSDFQSKNKAAK